MIIRLKRASKATWERKNPILGSGELCIEKADGARPARVKVGNGFAAWDDLPYSFESTSDENIEATIRAYLENFNWNSIGIGERYSTIKPIEFDIGGIPAGTTFNNARMTDVLNRLFYAEDIPPSGPFISGQVTFEPAISEIYTDELHTITSVQANIVKGTHDIVSVIFNLDGKRLGEVATQKDGGITKLTGLTNTVVGYYSKLECIVTDSSGAMNKKETTVVDGFVPRPGLSVNFFYGVLTSNPALNSIDPVFLTKIENATKTTQGPITLNGQGWVVFLTPKEFGRLLRIESPLIPGVSVLGDFNIEDEIHIDNTTYYVYRRNSGMNATGTQWLLIY